MQPLALPTALRRARTPVFASLLFAALAALSATARAQIGKSGFEFRVNTIQFLLGVQQTGSFRFFVIAEALPGQTSTSTPRRDRRQRCPRGLMKGGAVKRKN